MDAKRYIGPCTPTVTVACLLMAAFSARSQSNNQTAPESEGMLRSDYQQSPELPDEVAFLMMMVSIDNLSSKTPDLALASIQTEMRLSDSEAEAFRARLQETYKSYQAEVFNAATALACTALEQEVDREELYSTLEQIDDLNYSVAAKYLAQLRDTTENELAHRLDEALDSRKLHISHSTVRQKPAHEAHGLDPKNSVATLCTFRDSKAAANGYSARRN